MWLNLRKIYTLTQISPKKVPNHNPERYLPKEKMLRVVIWQLVLENFNRIEKKSQIKQPLIVSLGFKHFCKRVYVFNVPVKLAIVLMLLAMTNSSESDNPCCNNGNKMGEHC
jgi:hypothetical protein